ncbi:hypothetical protein [Rubritalea marina]|uniref:hypothetical protein n=1 Tax=Rubritalea marina TaxID=361055 RepID=UPI00036BF65A|nr:hypothetical protein [Rubritalea marina]
MKTKIKSVADELREDLDRCPDMRAQELIDLNESIVAQLDRFEGELADGQLEAWQKLRDSVAKMCDYAQKSKMRLLFGDHEVIEKLDVLHEKIDTEEMEDMVGQGRTAHELHGVSDVLKSLMMWKDK